MKFNNIFLIFLLTFLSIKNGAQTKDSIRYNITHFNQKQLIVPIGLMGLGIVTEGKIKYDVQHWRNENLPNFRNKTDDYLQFLPHGAVYAAEWIGMKPKTDWKNRVAIHIKGELLTLGMVYLLKKTINNQRPDGSWMSFPSGHTANAFAGATILAMEYQDKHPWVPFVAYGSAGVVGAMRIANNRHYISDVLFGAGLGILSMKAAYWTHRYRWNTTKTQTDPFKGVIYK